MSGRAARYHGRGIVFVTRNGWWRYRTAGTRLGWFLYDYASIHRRLSRRVHRARRKARQL